MSQTHWADRGRQLRFDTAGVPLSGSCFGLMRLGGASAAAGLPTAWVQVDSRGLCLGVVLDPDALEAVERMTGGTLYPGFGHLSPAVQRTALRLWRSAGSDASVQALRPLLVFLMEVERELSAMVQACPGRSRSHKRQVFGRMQRARLYLEGHRD